MGDAGNNDTVSSMWWRPLPGTRAALDRNAQVLRQMTATRAAVKPNEQPPPHSFHPKPWGAPCSQTRRLTAPLGVASPGGGEQGYLRGNGKSSCRLPHTKRGRKTS